MRLVRVALVLAAVASCQRQDPAGSGQGSGSGTAPADCALVVTRIQQAAQTQIDAAGSDSKAIIAKMMPVMEAACVQDRWPASLVQCITATKPGDAKALEHCNSLMPNDVQYKLQTRMIQLLPKPAGHPAPSQP